jgi:hypothetical protein
MENNQGEAIHQPLMQRKMAKLDEAGHWRPFKFRIQAFTHAFIDEVAAAGIPEAEASHKMVRRARFAIH